MRRPFAAALVAAMLASPALAQQQEPFEPEGFRTDNYRAPVPVTLEGARVLTTAEAEAIWRAKSGAFIDVMPRPPKPKNLPEGTVWRDAPRKDRAPEELERLLVERGVRLVMYPGWTSIDELERATGEKHGRPRVKLCTWDELLEAAETVAAERTSF